MKIVIATDSFKGNLTSLQAANAIEQGVRRVLPKAVCRKIPVADGGEGTVRALLDAVGGKSIHKRVMGPAGQAVRAHYAILSDQKTAVIEMAEAAGLHLVDDATRNPLNTTSFGVGQLIIAAIQNGAKKIIVGVGGSATLDAGMSMAQALGVRFFDDVGNLIEQPGCGGLLSTVAGMDISTIHPAIRKIKVTIASDVENPLFGEEGAAYVYGAQKGATLAMQKTLDFNLKQFSKLVNTELGRDAGDISGAGAAGGLGFGLNVFAKAKMKSGIELVAQLTGLKRHISGADLVITGEGRIDAQTAFGKTPIGVAKIARKLKVPVVAIGGTLSDDSNELFQIGIDGLEGAVVREMSLAEALKNSEAYLANAAERVIRLLLIEQKMRNR